MKKDFLWGGALATNQCEGAYRQDVKDLSIADIKTIGNRHKKEIEQKVFISKITIQVIRR